jgi:hypothetical protein
MHERTWPEPILALPDVEGVDRDHHPEPSDWAMRSTSHSEPTKSMTAPAEDADEEAAEDAEGDAADASVPQSRCRIDEVDHLGAHAIAVVEDVAVPRAKADSCTARGAKPQTAEEAEEHAAEDAAGGAEPQTSGEEAASLTSGAKPRATDSTDEDGAEPPTAEGAAGEAEEDADDVAGGARPRAADVLLAEE